MTRITWNKDTENVVTATFEDGKGTTVLVKVEDVKQDDGFYTLHFHVHCIGVVRGEDVSKDDFIRETRAGFQSCSKLMDGDSIQNGIKDLVHYFTSVVL